MKGIQHHARHFRMMFPFPSPRPSPLGRGGIVSSLTRNRCTVFAGKSSCNLPAFHCCSLSPRERVRVRGNGTTNYGLAISLLILLLAQLNLVLADENPRSSTKQFKTRFLKFCDLAVSELNKPITPFYSRTDDDPATHHMPFFEDAHAARALAVAYDMTGKRSYLDACKRWSDLMIVYQRGMDPVGAYYMNHQRAPGQKTGQWNLADSGSVGMGVLATATRCKDPAEKARYVASVKALAKLAMENYVTPEGGIRNGLWPEYDGPWWASTAIFGTLAFLLYEETGEEQYLNCGKAGVRWLLQTDFHDFKPITFEQRPSGIIFYTFEFYLAALKHFPPDSPEHEAILKQFDSAREWMAKNQKSRGANIPDYVEKNVDLAGLPYLMYGFAHANPRYQNLIPIADGELDYVGKLLLANGGSNVSKLMVWEVMTWGMLSHAERLKPGALLRGSRTLSNQKGMGR